MPMTPMKAYSRAIGVKVHHEVQHDMSPAHAVPCAAQASGRLMPSSVCHFGMIIKVVIRLYFIMCDVDNACKFVDFSSAFRKRSVHRAYAVGVIIQSFLISRFHWLSHTV